MLDKNTLKKWMLEDNGRILYDPVHPGIFSGYVTFTPERASLALENNTHNRPLGVRKQLPPICESIKEGYWNDNVSKINFAKDGTLSDGQHRLEGACRTGMAIRCLVTWGVDKNAQSLVDRRGNRTLADDIAMDGGKSAHNLAAITRVLYLRSLGHSPKILLNKGTQATFIPDVIYYDYYLKNKEEIVEKTKLVNRAYNSVRDLQIPGNIMNVLVIEFDSVSPSDAKVFWERLSTGLAFWENDPVVALRKKLSDNARANVNKIPNAIISALIIKAWNCFERGEQVKLLKYTAGGANPEPFPEIYNPYLTDSKETT